MRSRILVVGEANVRLLLGSYQWTLLSLCGFGEYHASKSPIFIHRALTCSTRMARG